ncbi:MAG: hypothetical protein K2I82_00370 [Ruminococcus sp.]|nr:hypothetical protein [Ruminococcus sp.]
MFLKMNIGDILDEYGIFLVWGAIFIYLLIKKSTRKIAFKILCIIFLFAFAVVAIFLICIWIFGFDNGFATGWLVLFNLLFSVMIYMSADELHRVIRLHKKGIRTYGTFIRRSARGGSIIVYSVDSRKYECISDSLGKYKIGCDKVPVVYDAENLENSCVEKHDFVPAIALLIASISLETGMIAITVYMCRYIFP